MAAHRVTNSIVQVFRNIASSFTTKTFCRHPGTVNAACLLRKNVNPATVTSSFHRHLSTHQHACTQPSLATPGQQYLQVSSFHTSIAVRGLEEFFDDPKNWGQPAIKAGRAWSKDELRLKDYVTLHKLWYVLLKEKNMLLSMQAEADRLEKFLPSPERVSKVEVSMANIQAVLVERQEALTELQTGHKEEHPGEWQYTPFGYKRYVKPKEYHMPKYMNRLWATKRKRYEPFVGHYLSRWYEQNVRRGAREKRREKNQLLKLRKRFPDSDVWENK